MVNPLERIAQLVVVPVVQVELEHRRIVRGERARRRRLRLDRKPLSVRGIVLFAHGARDPEWARPFEAIRDCVRKHRPEYPIALAYLEVMSPTLEEAIGALVDEGASAITVFPLFMAQGGHLKQDLPRILDDIRTAYPHLPIAQESAIGDVPEILQAIAAWILDRAE